MSGYLQRLFDRGAGLAAAPAREVAPAMASASPSVAFDQRLAEPGLAEDFGILGLEPDPEIPADGTPQTEAAALARSTPLGPPQMSLPAAALPRTAPASPQAAAPTEHLADRLREPGPPAHPQRQGTWPAPHPAMPQQPEGQQVPAWVLSQPVVRALAAWGPGESRESRDSREAVESCTELPLPRPAHSAGRAVDAAAVVQPMRPLSREARHAPQSPWPIVPIAQDPSIRVRPATAVPAARSTEPGAAPASRREVEPPRRMPQPLEPQPAAAPAGPMLERLVRETVRAELAHQPSARKAAGPAPQAAAGPAADGAPGPAPRPATAREASVIGELEPSSSPLTVYGLRRR